MIKAITWPGDFKVVMSSVACSACLALRLWQSLDIMNAVFVGLLFRE